MKNHFKVSLILFCVLMSSFAQVYDAGAKRNLAVTLRDWPESAPDFGYSFTCGGAPKNIAAEYLNAEGKPVKGTGSCIPNGFNEWFITQDIGEYTNATCYDLEITYDGAGSWVADYTSFFPMDDFKYLDAARTVINPFNQLNNGGTSHNYSFTMEVDAEFAYQPGQIFDFRGDDDVFVFIDGRLVVDLGGVHAPQSHYLDLDTLGLVPNQSYPFKIFFAERHCCGSSFRMSTNMDIKTNRELFVLESETILGTRYDIRQNKDWTSGNCDQKTANSDNLPVRALYTLEGSSIDPTALEEGVSFGGIIIAEGDSAISISIENIIASGLLPEGDYVIRVTHINDPTQQAEIPFQIPYTEVISFRLIDEDNNEISTSSIGEWSQIKYAVRLGVFKDGAFCSSCNIKGELSKSEFIEISNSRSEQITEVDFVKGVATIWVMGLAEQNDGWVKVNSESILKELTISPIVLKNLEVSIPSSGDIFDRNGDGIADSVVFKFKNLALAENYPDSLYLTWGTETYKASWGDGILKNGVISFTGNRMFSKVYTGSLNPIAAFGVGKFIYPTDGKSLEIEQALSDRVGPIIQYGELFQEGGSTGYLVVHYSEYIKTSSEELPLDLIDFKISDAHEIRPLSHRRVANGQTSVMLFSTGDGVMVGDSIRINPQYSQYSGLGDFSLQDYSDNLTHPENPFRVVLGDAQLGMNPLDFVSLQPQKEDVPSDQKPKSWVLFLVDPEQTSRESFQQTNHAGTQIDLNLGSLILGSDVLNQEDVSFQWVAEVYSNLGQFISREEGELKCDDEVFGGDCTSSNFSPYVGWNMKTEDGRQVGSGVYIMRVRVKIINDGDVLKRNEKLWAMGVKRNF